MQVNDYHRRQARAIIMNHFETAFGYRMFNDIGYAIDDSITVPVDGSGTKVEILDERGGSGNPLEGDMTITVTSGENAETNVPVHNISIVLCWGGSDGFDRECLTMTKQLARLEIQ
jgi:hypothetical protein